MMKSKHEKQQAGWDFIKWLTETKQSAYWTVQTNYLPVRKSAVNDPSLQDYIAKTPRFKGALDMISSGAPGISVAGWAGARTHLQHPVTAARTLTADPKAPLDDSANEAAQSLRPNPFCSLP